VDLVRVAREMRKKQILIFRNYYGSEHVRSAVYSKSRLKKVKEKNATNRFIEEPAFHSTL
jgi:hypothetical protein